MNFREGFAGQSGAKSSRRRLRQVPAVVSRGITPGSPQKALGKGGRSVRQLSTLLVSHLTDLWGFTESCL